MAEKMSIDHKDPRDESDEDLGSTPEGELPVSSSIAAAAAAAGLPPGSSNGNGPDIQQPKRKGGRKPVSHAIHIILNSSHDAFTSLHICRVQVEKTC